MPGSTHAIGCLVSSAFADGRHALQCRYLHLRVTQGHRGKQCDGPPEINQHLARSDGCICSRLLLDVAGQVSHRNSKVDQQVASERSCTSGWMRNYEGTLLRALYC